MKILVGCAAPALIEHTGAKRQVWRSPVTASWLGALLLSVAVAGCGSVSSLADGGSGAPDAANVAADATRADAAQGGPDAGLSPDLKSLVLSVPYALSPAFSAGTTSYSISTSIISQATTVTPTAKSSAATITVNGAQVASGTASARIPLALGSNTITVVVDVSGMTRTYTVNIDRGGAAINQLAYVKQSNTGTGDEFGVGTALAVDGDTIAVGAPAEDSPATGINPANDGDSTTTGADSGAVYVFRRTGTTWKQEAYIKASNTGKGDNFGTSVSISGDTLAVGAPAEDSAAIGINGDESNDTSTDSGAVYVYHRTGSTWTKQAYIKASNTGMGDKFGTSVSLDGDTLAVGAPGEASSSKGANLGSTAQADNGAMNSGAVYVFQRSGGTWTQQSYIKASNTGQGDLFGGDLSLSGDTLAVGARFEQSKGTGVDSGLQGDNSVNAAGAVYVFQRSGGIWSQQAYVKASNTGNGDLFGTSVALDGNTLAVGAPLEDSNGRGVNPGLTAEQNDSQYNSGAVYVFTRSGGTWTQDAYIKSSNSDGEQNNGSSNGDGFGESVFLDGNLMVVGAPSEQSKGKGVDSGLQADNSLSVAGAAYLFQRSGGTWAQKAYIKASNTDSGDHFSSIGLSDDTVVVGAFKEDSSAIGINGDQGNTTAGTDSGAVYVFR